MISDTIIMTLMQLIGILSLLLSAGVPILMVVITTHALLFGAKDFRHRGIRALFRLALCPIIIVCSTLILQPIYELLTLLFYVFH